MASNGTTWALPPRPPDTWLHPAWTPTLLAGLGVAALLPLWHTGLSPTPEIGIRTGLAVLACAGAAVTAYGLLVEHVVRGGNRLRWLAAGFAVQAELLLARALDLDSTTSRSLTALSVAAPAAFVLTSGLARRRRFAVAPLLLLAGLAALVWEGALPRSALGVAAALSTAAAVQWWHRVGFADWLIPPLVLGALACTALVGRPADGTWLWWTGSGLLTTGLVLSGAAMGLRAVTGFGRQSARWHRLEREVRAVRTGSPLMPSRSVIPDDDEGLPSQEELRALIDAGVVRIALQPVVHLDSGAVLGHEALSRFGGRVPTDRWFKGASRYGLGGELERLTVRKALETLDLLPPAEFLAVNVSPAALDDAQVIALLSACDLSRVVLEITEHEAVADYAVVRRVLNQMRDAGARIAVDDTGAGFASLRHVLMLQPDIIKLDTSLTRGVERDPKQQALVRAVTGFAAQVGAQVLAEGIEEQVQLEALQAIGVRWGQGWHLGVPEFPAAGRA